MASQFKPGDAVICRLTKRSTHPGPRAEEVIPTEHGETYTYHVDKFWRVKQITSDGKLVLFTRGGKEHVCDPEDRRLRKPGFIARILYRDRFPAPSDA